MVDPETFEYRQEPQICDLTPDNIKTLERRRWESLERLYGKYKHGGSSPQNTYLEIAQRYADVDVSYAEVGDE